MLLDVANRKASGGQFSGSRQTRNPTANDKNVQDLYVVMMPQRSMDGFIGALR